ncbi:MAG: hypothetical protein H0T68_00535 [Gemmatimonadales bacterium]|nr:hypothetical protein [Gemmatimonadales bacterium]
MRTTRILAAALVVAACSRNPEPEVEATGGANTTVSDTTMMAGDSLGDSVLVNQEGAAQPRRQTMESDTVMGDSTLVGQADDTRAPGDTSMMHGDSTMTGPETSVEDAVPTDSAQGQRR